MTPPSDDEVDDQPDPDDRDSSSVAASARGCGGASGRDSCGEADPFEQRREPSAARRRGSRRGSRRWAACGRRGGRGRGPRASGRDADRGADEEATGRNGVSQTGRGSTTPATSRRRPVSRDPIPTARSAPSERDLGGEEQRADREASGPDAERHPDPDLAPLRLDDPADEVEGGECGAEQDEQPRRRCRSSGRLGVLVEDPVGLLVGLAGDRRRPRRAATRRTRGAARASSRGSLSRARADDELVHVAGGSGEPLRGLQRRVEHGVARGPGPKSSAGPVAKRNCSAGTTCPRSGRGAAGERDGPGCGSFCVVGEVALAHADRVAVVVGRGGCARARAASRRRRGPRRCGRPACPARGRLARPSRRRPGWSTSRSWLAAASAALGGARQGALGDEGALGEADPEVVVGEHVEARVVGVGRQLLRAPRPGRRPVPRAMISAIASDLTAGAAGRASDQRSQRAAALHRATSAGRRSRPAARGRAVGDDAAADSSITRSATREISRLWVTTSTVVPELVRWSCSSSRICTPVWKSSSPVGSSASRIGLPVASARAIATRCCSPPDSWCGEVARGGRRGRRRAQRLACAAARGRRGRRRRRRTGRSRARSARGTG